MVVLVFQWGAKRCCFSLLDMGLSGPKSCESVLWNVLIGRLIEFWTWKAQSNYICSQNFYFLYIYLFWWDVLKTFVKELLNYRFGFGFGLKSVRLIRERLIFNTHMHNIKVVGCLRSIPSQIMVLAFPWRKKNKKCSPQLMQ